MSNDLEQIYLLNTYTKDCKSFYKIKPLSNKQNLNLTWLSTAAAVRPIAGDWCALDMPSDDNMEAPAVTKVVETEFEFGLLNSRFCAREY